MNLETYVGDSLRILCSTKTRSGGNQPLDVSTSAIEFKAVTSRGTPRTLIKSVGAGITITGGPAGSFRVDLVPNDTTVAGVFKFSIRVTVDATHIHTVAVGTLTIHPSL